MPRDLGSAFSSGCVGGRMAAPLPLPRPVDRRRALYTILHVSDIHRSPADPIGNPELLSSLTHDFDHWQHETPAIRAPDALVLSGDLVYGVPLGHPDFENELDSQYATALDLLTGLADRLFDGDRSRVVLVPGNHDICWNTALAAMKPVDLETLRTPVKQLLDQNGSVYRWSWEDLALYRIHDRTQYRARLDRYRACVAEFYRGSPIEHEVDPRADFNIYELSDGEICVAAFNSCDWNDCFARKGAISEDSLADCDLAIRDSGKAYRLHIAVWHHDFEGGPGRDDYMDFSTIQKFVAKGFRLGLHGHHHRSQMSARTVSIPPLEERMVVASAGSLCAGGPDLPSGVNRQYNVLELDLDARAVRVHVREVSFATTFAAGKRAEFGGQSYLDMSWSPPITESSRAATARQTQAVVVAEEEYKRGDLKQALNTILSTGIISTRHGRRLFVAIASELGSWALVLEHIPSSHELDEAFLRTRALAEIGRYDEARKEARRAHSAFGLSAPGLTELNQMISALQATKT